MASRVVRWKIHVVTTGQIFEVNLITDLPIPELYKAIAKCNRQDFYLHNKKGFGFYEIINDLNREYGINKTKTYGENVPQHQESITTYVYIERGMLGPFGKGKSIMMLPKPMEELLEEISYQLLYSNFGKRKR